jgi:hypothetical protein
MGGAHALESATIFRLETVESQGAMGSFTVEADLWLPRSFVRRSKPNASFAANCDKQTALLQIA